MSSPVTQLADSLQAHSLARVVTRLINAPSVALTRRDVAEPERVLVPTPHGDVPCHITRAAPGAPLAAGTAGPPVHVNPHGGAFLIGAPQQDDHLVRGTRAPAGSR